MTVVIWLVLLLTQSPSQSSKPPRTDARGLLAINREFYDLAAATGGDFYFWAAGEFASSRLQVPIENEEIVLAYASVDGKLGFEVPVESDVRALTLFAGVQRKDLTVIIRPDGTVARDGQRGVTVQTFQHMTIASIESPPAGTWHLELNGAGMYAVTAHVRPREGGILLTSAQFVEQRGRPGHEGLFPIEKPLPPRSATTCRVRVDGNPRAVHLAFFRRDGMLIASRPMTDEGDGEFLAPCSVPDEPFRFGVMGTDDQGRPFQRIDRPLRECSCPDSSPSSQ